MSLPGISLFTILVGVGSECDKHSSGPIIHKLEKVGDVRRNILRQSVQM
jgi:hypothetical protein